MSSELYDRHIVDGAPPMNRVPLARRVQVINCLVEGNSIRSTERITGMHRDTHRTLRVTPTMDRRNQPPWSLDELVERTSI
jgi:hypothetical protein